MMWKGPRSDFGRKQVGLWLHNHFCLNVYSRFTRQPRSDSGHPDRGFAPDGGFRI